MTDEDTDKCSMHETADTPLAQISSTIQCFPKPRLAPTCSFSQRPRLPSPRGIRSLATRWSWSPLTRKCARWSLHRRRASVRRR